MREKKSGPSLFLTISLIFLCGIYIFSFLYFNSNSSNNTLKNPPRVNSTTETCKPKEDNSTMVVLIPGFYWDDLAEFDLENELPNFTHLMEQGALGLMNTTVKGPYHRAAGYLTLGTGARALVHEDSKPILALEEKYNDEEAKTVFSRNTGVDLKNNFLELDSKTSTAVAVEFPKLLSQNLDLNHRVEPGLLASKLNQKNVSLIYHGNADTCTAKRYGALMAMNQAGVISQAILSPEKTLTRDKEFPYGHKNDYSKIYHKVENQLNILATTDATTETENFVYVLELGDGIRIEEYQESLAPSIKESLKEKTLKNIDRLLGKIVSLGAQKDFQIMIMNPSPSREDYHEGRRLTPIMISSPGNKDALNVADVETDIETGTETKSFLTSSTTRRKGLVANTDILPTLLGEFEEVKDISRRIKGNEIKTEKLHEISSRKVHSGLNGGLDGEVKSEDMGDQERQNPRLNHLVQLEQELVKAHNMRPPILTGYIITQVIIIALALLQVITGIKIPYIKTILYAILVTPIVFLIAPLFSLNTTWSMTFFLLIVSALGSIFLQKYIHHDVLRLAVVFLLTSGVILIPFITGHETFVYRGLLSHDPISGARYYGLGNELMGILIGSFTVGLFGMFSHKPGWIKSYYLLGSLLALFFFYPAMGANFGGGVSAVAVFGALMYMVFFDKIRGKHRKTYFFLAVLGFMAVFLGGFFGFNLFLDGSTHLGRAVNIMIYEGPRELIPIAVRKLTLNLTLLRYSNWSFVLLSFLAVLFLNYLKYTRIMAEIEKNHPLLKSGILSVVVGGFVAFFVNDSGVLAAATMFLYVSVPLLLLGHKFTKPSNGTSN